MSYENKDVLETLRLARQKKGLSQRDLSQRIGVPQGHISKIENNSVDPQLSSLIQWARALDLELQLVPKKALSAVESIVRSTGPKDDATYKAHEAIKKTLTGYLPAAKNAAAREILTELRRFPYSSESFSELIKHLANLKSSRGEQEAINSLKHLRNWLIHDHDAFDRGNLHRAYTLEADDV